MKREIFEVDAKIVDANGSYNILSGYPKTFDSKNYGNDIDKAEKRALGDCYEVLSQMAKRDDRQLQTVRVTRISDLTNIAQYGFGKIADLPDPEPEEETEPEE